MANQTVYPYGQGGQLPSGYPIADDLNTDSAQQALSAKQGVVLNKKITESDIAIDLSLFPIFTGIITSSGVWSSGTSHKTVQIPVLTGQVYRIKAHATQGSYYTFFASFSPFSAGNAPDYTDGYDNRIYIQPGVTEDIAIPADATYLYVALFNQSTDQSPQSISLIESPPAAIAQKFNEQEAQIEGDVIEMCDYDTDAFSGTSSNQVVTKVGEKGYLLENKAKAAGKYFLYELPAGLVDGKTYLLSFKYSSWLSSTWFWSVVNGDSSVVAAPSRGVTIPQEGIGKVSFRFTFLNGDKYLRLASNSQDAGTALLIDDLSISPYESTIADLTKRVDALDGGHQEATGTFHHYFGRRIDLAERSYIFDAYMVLTSHQSSACYGDYAVTFTDKMATIRLYNLRTRQLLATVTQTALDSFHHCNQAFFGTEFYAEGDAFPLVYLTVNNNGTEAGGYMEAYRIVPTMGTNDYSSFTIELVQVVTLPIMSAENALGNANFVLDSVSGFLYTYSRNNDSADANYGICRITKWPMPTLAQGNVTFTDADRLDTWETDTLAANMQGAAIGNHLLFIFRGGYNIGYTEIHVFDLVRHDRVALIDLRSDGFTLEPEGAFFWGNTLCTTTGNLFRFLFR